MSSVERDIDVDLDADANAAVATIAEEWPCFYVEDFEGKSMRLTVAPDEITGVTVETYR